MNKTIQSKLKQALAILLRKPAQKTEMKQPTKADLEKRFKIVMPKSS